MFKEIETYKIIVQKGNDLNYIPNLISPHPLDQLFKATEWLFNEAVKDWNDTHKEIKNRRELQGYSKENLDAWDDLSIRLGSRTQGYVNQLCLMEDILKFEYKRMAKLVAEASADSIKIEPESDYASLSKDFEEIRTFRNKVIAHTAYTWSKDNDSPETVVRSILNLFPSSAKYTMGDNFFSGSSPYISQIPVISIFQWKSDIKPIFERWKKLFIDTLGKIHSHCPYKRDNYKIRIASPHKIQ